jgi:hypothetical protein
MGHVHRHIRIYRGVLRNEHIPNAPSSRHVPLFVTAVLVAGRKLFMHRQIQACTNFGRPIACAAEFCTVTPNIA